MLERSDLIQNRFDKIAALRAKEINPFVNRYAPTHKAADILGQADDMIASEKKIIVAGRIITIRSFGKAAFFHIQDNSGRIQCFVKKGMIPDDEFTLFTDYMDSGDIVGIEGTVFRTKTDEVTVLASRIALLTKSVRPLPEKWHGLRDTDTRYRRRYVDLIVNQNVREAFAVRSRMMGSCRRFLENLGYMEVETPMMHPISGGALARPFKTHHNALDMPLYLRIAPELYLKRLLVGGYEKIFEINRNFRNEGISIRHNPEFTMMELYTAWWDYNDTAALLEKMIRHIAMETIGRMQIVFQGHEIDLDPSGGWKRLTILDAVREHLGMEFSWSDNPADVRQKVQDHLEISPGELKDMSAADMIIALFEEKIEPLLIEPTFIMEYPKAKSPLAKTKADDPLVAERFELFIGAMEIANAYSELNDPEEQLLRFQEQLRRREQGDQEAMCVDEDYIRALEHGMPPASGLGVGMDRLAMLLTDSGSIRDVILFPALRPEQGRSDTAGQDEESGEEEAES